MERTMIYLSILAKILLCFKALFFFVEANFRVVVDGRDAVDSSLGLR